MNFILPVSSKGQFTIPSSVRKHLKITKGSLLKVTLLQDKAVLESYATQDITDFFGTLQDAPPSREEIQKGLWSERQKNKTHETHRP